ncbi:MAG: hypothetical protein RLZZ196_492 [Bacteroidota bacterium]|jgi:hypothetical protein
MLNETQIADIWLNFVDYIEKKSLDTCAERFVDLLADLGVPDKVLKSVIGVDEYLDQAVEYYLGDDEEPEEDDEYKELDF